MAKSKKQIIEEVVESFDWSVRFETQKGQNGKTEKYVAFDGFSDAGEDLELIEFYDNLCEIPDKLFERYEDFDVEEHVSMWLEGKQNGVRCVPDVETLVKDAKWIENFILELAEALRDALTGRKPRKKPDPNDKLQELFDLIDRRDRAERGVYDAWDKINGLVNEVYGIDIGDALVLWTEKKGA